MGLLKFVLEWVKRLFSLVKLAQRLEKLESRMADIENRLAPVPKNISTLFEVHWGGVGEERTAYCPLCAADHKWLPMAIRKMEDTLLLVCPICKFHWKISKEQYRRAVIGVKTTVPELPPKTNAELPPKS